jgi:hypothetical protein
MTHFAAASRSAPKVGMPSPRLPWSKRLAIAGFLFFLCKGLLWLAVFVAAWWLH